MRINSVNALLNSVFNTTNPFSVILKRKLHYPNGWHQISKSKRRGGPKIGSFELTTCSTTIVESAFIQVNFKCPINIVIDIFTFG